MSKKLRIYLVDDHALFREGLAFLLSNTDFIAEVYQAQNGLAFVDSLDSINPDIVLLDIEMPIMDGITATKQAIEKQPQIRIIALSMYAHETYYSEMIDAGAKGFLLKNSAFDDVKRAIVDVSEGNNYFSPEILDGIVRKLNKKSPKDQSDLTEREIEILYNICKGYSNAEIGEMLSISKRTVDKHRENLLLKTESKNTAGLVIYAIKNGFFEV
jgi:two-component system, NarL family, response regulator LiaR